MALSKISERVSPPPQASKGKKRLFSVLSILLALVVLLGFRYGYRIWTMSPTLLTAEQADQEQVISPKGAFVLQFDQRMKKETVSAAISISPEIDWNEAWDGTELVLRPKEALKTGDQYLIEVEKTAQNLFGRPLDKAVYIHYLVGPPPGIEGLFPEEGDLEGGESISVIFSHAMSPETKLILSPQPRGSWKWYNEKTLVFTPAEDWPSSSRFELYHDEPLMSADETELEEKIQRRFQTTRLQLLAPATLQKISVRDPIELSFNQPLYQKDLHKFLIIRDQTGRQVSFTDWVQSEENPSTWQVSIRKGQWLYNHEYTLEIDERLMPERGNIPLGENLEVRYQTESLLEFAHAAPNDPKVFQIHEEQFDFVTREPISLEVMKQSLMILPKIPYEIEQLNDQKFRITLPKFSQKRENIELIVAVGVNPERSPHIGEPLSFTGQPLEEMQLNVEERGDFLCVFSNLPLVQSSYLSQQVEGKEKKWRLETQEPHEECLGDEGEMVASFQKTYLEPGRALAVQVHGEDAFGRVQNRELQITTRPLENRERSIRPEHQFFYQYASNPEEMVYSYRTKNVPELIFQLCQLTGELAVEIETRYEEKWNSFIPSPQKCQRFSSVRKVLGDAWGKEQLNSINLAQEFDDLGTGLYYVFGFSPNLLGEENERLEVRGVMQFTQWQVLSKRGESTLVWVVDTDQQRTLPDVTVNLFGIDGSLLQSGKTDDKGLYFLNRTRLKHEFILVKGREQEVLVSVFSEEGFEPQRFQVPFNVDESNYRYQYYLEDFSPGQSALKGVFVLKEMKNGVLQVPKISSAVLTLYDQQERLLWRTINDIDDQGNLMIDIQPSYPLLDDQYQLSVCLGLHEGVCHGTNLWTTLKRSPSGEETLADEVPELTQENNTINYRGRTTPNVGDTIRFDVSQLRPSVPVMVTVEREMIYWQTVLVPEKEIESFELTVTEEMIPELIVTVTQFLPDETFYDMERIAISPESRKLIIDPSQTAERFSGLQFTNANGTTIDQVSRVVFRQPSRIGRPEHWLEAFYPPLGTSMITGAVQFKLPETSAQPFPYLSSFDIIPDVIFVDGEFLGVSPQDLEINPEASYFVFAHSEQGHFGAEIIKQPTIASDIRIEPLLPSFIRPFDQITLVMEVFNESRQNANLNLRASSPYLTFLSGSDSLFGLPSGQSKVIALASKAEGLKGVNEIPLRVDVRFQGGSVNESLASIPVRHRSFVGSQQKLITLQAQTDYAKVILPIMNEGIWERRVILSPSPMSFVLESLSRHLGKEPTAVHEGLLKMTTAANFSALLNPDEYDQLQLFELLSQQNTLETELMYLESLQNFDGGWSSSREALESEAMHSAWIAKSLGVLQELGLDLPEAMRGGTIRYLKTNLDQRSNRRVREAITPADISDQEELEELFILNGLSSLTASGVSYANNWYFYRESLNTESLVLLLLTLEDFRDAGVGGMNFKIEEVTQMLKTAQQKTEDQSWLIASQVDGSFSDFMVTSWFLEGLVRQASARSDIPSIINWLVGQKQRRKYLSQRQQFVYLQSMASYLRIFSSELNAQEVELIYPDESRHLFDLDPERAHQTFSLSDIFQTESSEAPTITLRSDLPQAWFMEVSWKKASHGSPVISEGLTVYVEMQDQENSRLSIISAESQEDLIVIQPQIAGIEISLKDSDTEYRTISSSKGETWYVIEELPAGKTDIDFTWEPVYPGVYQTPQVSAYVNEQPEIYAVSNGGELVVKP